MASQYPLVSHTFIRREIAELERRGFAVRRLSIRSTAGLTPDPADAREAEKTFTCLNDPAASLVARFAGSAIRRPRGTARALKEAWRHARKSHRTLGKHLAYVVEAVRLAALLEAEGIGHVHVHFGTNAATVASIMKKLAGVSFSMTVHGSAELDSPLTNNLRDKVAEADFTVAVSHYTRGQLMRFSDAAHWDRIHIVPCTVDDSFFADCVPVPPETRDIVCVGRLSPEKGQLLLLDAFAEAVSDGTPGRLVMVGDGPVRAQLESRIDSLGLRDRVEMAGWQNEAQIKTRVRAARALVLPSFYEGLPVVIMEAMAMAAPGPGHAGGRHPGTGQARRERLADPGGRRTRMGGRPAEHPPPRRGRVRPDGRQRPGGRPKQTLLPGGRGTVGSPVPRPTRQGGLSMCGIAGAFGSVGPQIVGAVKAADAAQRHRGPNDCGFWRDAAAGVALAHRRLSILDLSPLGHQPMIDGRTGTALVFNGEIYNFRDLKADLIRAGHRFRSESDTEVVLRGYVEWGEVIVDRMEGMFAIAAWNPRRRELFLARDPLGQKPLYYAVVPGAEGGTAFLFASELRALLATGLIERRIAPAALNNYVWNGFVPGPEMIVEGIHQLPPGHKMTLEAGPNPVPETRPFWSLPAPSADFIAPADVEALIRRVLKEHLAADVPLGVFLSGGIDSSAVAKMAADAGGPPVKTFTIGFEESQFDETEAATRIAAAVGTEHRNIRLGGRDFLDQLPAALQSLDQPSFDGLNSYIVSRAVREAGLTVALAGTGGDELFGGYRSFRDVPMATRWGRRLRTVPRPIRQLVSRIAAGDRGGMRRQTRWGKVRDVIETGDSLVSVYQLAYGLFTPEFAESLLGRNALGTGGLPAARFADLCEQTRAEPPLSAVSRLECSLFLGDRLLRDTDAASMASSLEVRLPLLDRRIVEAVAKLAPDDRFFPLGRKDFLRERILRGLDPALFESPKKGFVLPFDVWCRGPLRPMLDASLTDSNAIRAVGLEPAPVRKLWNAFLENKPGLYWSRVWSLHALIDWSKRHGMSV